jgi:RNA 2',3'-cyclic 3'-phosphodiesterase
MKSEKNIRAFLAIEPPSEIRQQIANIQTRLKGSCPFDVRWVKPDGIHLTLKFFGDISEADIAAISEVAERNVRTAAPLHFEVKKLGVFPSLTRPRVVWIGLTGDTSFLLDLQKKLDQGFFDCGFQKEERPFRPHLTLGRIKTSKVPGDSEKFIQRDDCDAGNFTASGLHLIKSDLTPQGAVYTKLAWFPLGER